MMIMLKKFFILLLVFYSLSAFPLNLQQEPVVRAYIQQISRQYNFNEAQLNKLFHHVEFNPAILAKWNPPPAPPSPGPKPSYPWYEYRNAFVTQQRVERGVMFWKKNKAVLMAAQQRYGVPAEVIAGIIGVESMYGPDQGKYTVINT